MCSFYVTPYVSLDNAISHLTCLWSRKISGNYQSYVVGCKKDTPIELQNPEAKYNTTVVSSTLTSSTTMTRTITTASTITVRVLTTITYHCCYVPFIMQNVMKKLRHKMRTGVLQALYICLMLNQGLGV